MGEFNIESTDSFRSMSPPIECNLAPLTNNHRMMITNKEERVTKIGIAKSLKKVKGIVIVKLVA